MQIAALTFMQELAKTALGAFATALFVAFAGYLAAGRWNQKREAARLESEKELDRQREDEERARERARREFDLRAQLVEEVTAEAARMYIVCQYTSRVIKKSRRVIRKRVDSNPQDGARDQIISSLHEAYLSFSTRSQMLENLIGARYGIAWQFESDERSASAFLRWHQVRDLLTLYYFNLCGNFPGDVLCRNSRSDDKYHSGLNADGYFEDANYPNLKELRRMRIDIRHAYDEALGELTRSLLVDRIAIDATEIGAFDLPSRPSRRRAGNA
ncbi:hypothetical protein [Streptomyces sp. NPDC001250]|uniref:hypothetical protein n=1 Tax=unclassified Streptomyces TaxID=2593676 RepID=UPI0033167503